MNDDDHRYGALRESYAFEYAVLEQADKNANTHFNFETYDTYSWYLDLGPLSNINAKYLHGSIPYWNSIVEHPDYDAFWKDEAWVTQIKGAFVPNLNVAGFWDQEDPWGPWEIYRRSETERSQPLQLHRRRPVVSRAVAQPEGRVDRTDLVSAVTTPPPSSANEDRGAVVPLLAARQGREVSVEGVDVPDRLEFVAHLRDVAAAVDRDHEAVSARATACCRSTRRRRATVPCSTAPIPRDPVPVPAASDFADLSGRRLAALGSRRSAVRGRTVPTWRRGSARPLDRRPDGDRRAGRRPVRVDDRARTAISS